MVVAAAASCLSSRRERRASRYRRHPRPAGRRGRGARHGATGATGDAFVVFLSGDGGWADIDRRIAERLAERGLPVVGLDLRDYSKRQRTPDELSRDVARLIRTYGRRWHRERVAIVGFSRGANLAPFAVSRLPDDLRARLALVTMIGLNRAANFKWHFQDVFRDVKRADDVPTIPEVEKLANVRMICVYGADESGVRVPRRARQREASRAARRPSPRRGLRGDRRSRGRRHCALIAGRRWCVSRSSSRSSPRCSSWPGGPGSSRSRTVEQLAAAIERARGAPLIAVAFVATYAIATAAGVPATPFTLAGGALFGAGWGIALNWTARCSPPSSRSPRRAPRARSASTGTSGRIAQLAGDGGARTLFRLRLIPVAPFALLNAGAALSGMSWRGYLVATAVGIIPITVIYTISASELVAGVAGSGARALMLALGSAAVLIALSFIPSLMRAPSGRRHVNVRFTIALAGLVVLLAALLVARRWPGIRKVTDRGGDWIGALAPRLFALTTFVAGAILLVVGRDAGPRGSTRLAQRRPAAADRRSLGVLREHRRRGADHSRARAATAARRRVSRDGLAARRRIVFALASALDIEQASRPVDHARRSSCRRGGSSTAQASIFEERFTPDGSRRSPS